MQSLPTHSNYTQLRENNYAAADMLIQQSRNNLSLETAIETGILTEVNKPGVYTALGRIIPSQIGARFVQLGYTVKTLSYESMSGSQAQGSDQGNYMQDQSPADVLIAGNYALGRKDVFVNLRLVEIGSGKILAAYDYNVPLTSDIRELSKTEEEKGRLFSF
jgi:hypothetical protein